MKSLRILALAAALVAGGAMAAVAAPVNCPKKVESFDFVVDYSGSMLLEDSSQKATMKKDGTLKHRDMKLEIAKLAMRRVNDTIPNHSFNSGLHTITPSTTIAGQGPWDRGQLKMQIGSLKTGGIPVFGRMTGMGDGFQGYEPFLSAMKRDAAVILVTDGDNNRGADLVDTVRKIYDSQRDLTLHIISLADTPNGRQIIKNVAALNPNTVVVPAADLVNSDAELEKFVTAAFCGKRKEPIVLEGVHFAYDSAALDARAKGILDNIYEQRIKPMGDRPFVITGWTDKRGSAAYNQRLSLRRAQSVKAYLEKKGVPASRMTTIGGGISTTYGDSDDAETRYKNRRMEIDFK